jgi:hypothetical protein
MQICMHMHACKYICTRVHTHKYHTCTHDSCDAIQLDSALSPCFILISVRHTQIHTHTHKHTCTRDSPDAIQWDSPCFMYLYMHTCTHTHTRTHKHTCTRDSPDAIQWDSPCFTYLYMHVYTYTRTYISYLHT